MTNKYERQSLESVILKALQSLGGNASRKAIKDEIIEDDSNNITYENVYEPVISRKGTAYCPFNYDFNFGFINLRTCGYIQDYSRNSDITLTELGRNVNYKDFPTEEDSKIMKKYWERNKKVRSTDDGNDGGNPEIDQDNERDLISSIDNSGAEEEWRVKVIEQIKNFSPKKFESFSRALLSKMGVKFDAEKGIKMSGDHGIDGYGYFESDEFRTAKVVIQCKRFTDCPVSEPDIDKFKGAMMSFNADYGIFITTSYFTKQAQEKAVQGVNTVTLINGQRLVDLIEKYQLYISPIQTYELEEYYFQKD